MPRSTGILPCECVRLGRAFRQGILPWRKVAGVLPATLRACRPSLTAV